MTKPKDWEEHFKKESPFYLELIERAITTLMADDMIRETYGPDLQLIKTCSENVRTKQENKR